MDPLFPGSDDYPLPGKLKRIRPVSSRGQGRRTWSLIRGCLTDTNMGPIEPNAGRDDYLGFNLSLAMV